MRDEAWILGVTLDIQNSRRVAAGVVIVCTRGMVKIGLIVGAARR